jgi:hypothetical protein
MEAVSMRQAVQALCEPRCGAWRLPPGRWRSTCLRLAALHSGMISVQMRGSHELQGKAVAVIILLGSVALAWHRPWCGFITLLATVPLCMQALADALTPMAMARLSLTYCTVSTPYAARVAR